MRPRQFVAVGALSGTVALAGWSAAHFGWFGFANAARSAGDRGVTVAALADWPTAAPVPSEPATVTAAVSTGDALKGDALKGDALTVVPKSSESGFVLASASATEVPLTTPPLLDFDPTPSPETRVQIASLSTPDPVKEDPKPAIRMVDTSDECVVIEVCVDEYLWTLYERAPKLDTNKVTEKIKETVKRKGKTRTVTKTITKYVPGDFTWKDPAAAEKAGMSLKDYVIGGMDRSFKLKLYHALRATDDAGLMPGITSAFRDDYRQSIAVGNKAASDSSFHGGSRRGGYGYGLAADVVSVRGETRSQRSASSEELWKWIDAHEKELGIGRPYLDRDPPHVGPIDGREYVAKRGLAKVQKAALSTKNAQQAKSETKKPQDAKLETKKPQPAASKSQPVASKDSGATKNAKPARSSKVSSLPSQR